MLNQIIYWIGAAVCVAGGIAIAAYALIASAMLSNRAQRAALNTCGGWKVFMEYRDWYNKSKAQQDSAQAAGEEGAE